MPEGHILQRRLCVPAHHARQTADLLSGNGIALVWHGRRSLLLFAEEFFRLAYLGALQMADLGSNLIQCGSDYGQRSDVVGMTIALDDLR